MLNERELAFTNPTTDDLAARFAETDAFLDSRVSLPNPFGNTTLVDSPPIGRRRAIEEAGFRYLGTMELAEGTEDRWVGPDGAIMLRDQRTTFQLVVLFDNGGRIALGPGGQLPPERAAMLLSSELVSTYHDLVRRTVRTASSRHTRPLFIRDIEQARRVQAYYEDHIASPAAAGLILWTIAMYVGGFGAIALLAYLVNLFL